VKVVVVSVPLAFHRHYLPVLLLLSMMILVVRWPVRVRPFCLLGVSNWSFLQQNRKKGVKKKLLVFQWSATVEQAQKVISFERARE